jgi:hypothetical protein
MTIPQLGTLRAVEPRTMWPDEAADFTPWLARPESIQSLGRAIGLELEVEHTEMAVGPFAADILARDSATGDYVIIENQLARTNHDHLGKAITYAAFLGATTVVWVAPAFTNEHRKALDWLNDKTVDTLSFFGVAAGHLVELPHALVDGREQGTSAASKVRDAQPCNMLRLRPGTTGGRSVGIDGQPCQQGG